jgi:hypothetical protein
MALFPFSNARRPRQYNYKPIYWNPEKEAKEERSRRVKRELGMDTETTDDYKKNMKGAFVQGTSHLKKSMERGDDSWGRASRNGKLGVVLVFLLFAFWYFYIR